MSTLESLRCLAAKNGVCTQQYATTAAAAAAAAAAATTTTTTTNFETTL